MAEVTLPQTPSFRLDDRRAVVTGAGRGIGVGMAAALAQAGAQVLAVLSSGRLSEGRRIGPQGGVVGIFVLDTGPRKVDVGVENTSGVAGSVIPFMRSGR